MLSRRLPRGLLPALAGAMLISAGAALPAAAQQQQGQTGPRGQTIQQMAQSRLARLKEELRITPAEEPAWSQFSQLSMQNAGEMEQMYRQRVEQVPSMNAVQNLQTFAELQTRQAQNFEKLVPAFQQLYSELSPEQRQTADEAFRSMAEQRGRRPVSRG